VSVVLMLRIPAIDF